MRAHRLFCSIFSCATLLAIATMTNDARAVEREHHLGLGPDLALLDVADKSTMSVGVGGGIHYTYGMNDMFNLMVEGSYSVVAANQQQDNPDSPRTRPAAIGMFGMGIGYVIDILTFVPYIGVLATGGYMVGGTLDHNLALAGGTLAAGLDYKLSRTFAVGLAYRQTEFLNQVSTYPSYSQFFLRGEYVWGF